ncbi:hypothetical protein [Albibacillus kandeliae]|uniref:hypothetical protein n=1 Tax=Albibacillus kandeliae TaxID=2174228 RepID=UPI000D68BDBC|nr:hypothetical protein [Albibacillus kandeliae]
MKPRLALFAIVPLIAGCLDDSDGDLSGTPSEFAQMKAPCVSQAARMTNIPADQIVVTNEIQTGGGPLLTLDARGTSYSCRKEADGSVTVFSEFAN